MERSETVRFVADGQPSIWEPSDADLQFTVARIAKAPSGLPGRLVFWLGASSPDAGPYFTLELRAGQPLLYQEFAEADDDKPVFSVRVHDFTPEMLLSYARLLARGATSELAACLQSPAA